MGKMQFRWGKVGDGGPEPVVVIGKKGERVAYTFKCPDPFYVDEPDSPISIGAAIDVPYDELTPEQRVREDALAMRRERAYRSRHPAHGYSGFGRATHPEPDA